MMTKTFISAALLIVFMLILPLQAEAATTGQEILLGSHKTVYWQPSANGQDKAPLILFSHGFKSCATQSSFLMAALAASGYWVFAPDHDDASCLHNPVLKDPDYAFGDPSSWDDTTYADRADDLRDVLESLQHDSHFKDKIDFTHIGLIGHSLGGYTVLGLAGAWPSWKRISGVKAVLALSPYTQPYIDHHSIGNVKVPVMYQGGTRDIEMTPPIIAEGGSFDQARAPKYFVELDRANHLAWTDSNRQYRATIIAYSTAFLDHYLKGKAAVPALTTSRGDVAEFRYESDLGKSGAPGVSQQN